LPSGTTSWSLLYGPIGIGAKEGERVEEPVDDVRKLGVALISGLAAAGIPDLATRAASPVRSDILSLSRCAEFA
jgi:hypothetical protein